MNIPRIEIGDIVVVEINNDSNRRLVAHVCAVANGQATQVKVERSEKSKWAGQTLTAGFTVKFVQAARRLAA